MVALKKIQEVIELPDNVRTIRVNVANTIKHNPLIWKKQRGGRSLPLLRSRPCYEAACSACLLATQHTMLQDVRAWAKSDPAKINKLFHITQTFF